MTVYRWRGQDSPLDSVQGTLALDLQPRQDPPAGAGVHTGTGADVVPIDVRARQQMEAWAARFVQAAMEIIGGDRPGTQLVRWTSAAVYDDITRRAVVVASAGGHRPGQARVQPVSPKVVGVRTCFVSPEVVEAGVHVRYGRRSRAIAARFERSDERWVCTALEFA